MTKKSKAKNAISQSEAGTSAVPAKRMNKHMRAMLDHLWGPTGSVILHIILIFALYRYLVWDLSDEAADMEVTIRDLEVREIDPMEDIDIPDIDDFADMSDDIRPPDIVDDRPPDPTEFERDMDVDTAPLDVLPDMQSPLVLRELYAARTESGREAMLGRHAGRWGRFTEPAVILALEWLKDNQRPDGSWEAGREEGDLYVTAVTGLGLMAFLAHGETHTSERYGATVRKALDYLLEAQRNYGEEGAFCRLGHHGPYSHGIATYAISEAYAMTKIPELRDSMDAALRHVIRGQQPGGGYAYSFNRGADRDTSISGWMVQAMKAAQMAGSQVEGLQEALDKASEDLKGATMPNGRFQYRASGSHQSVTAIGTLSLQLAGHGRHEAVVNAVEFMRDEECSWDNAGRDFPLYNWFYLTQAKFHYGGSVWERWNNQFAPAYVDAQEADGRWVSPSSNLEGGFSEHRYGHAFTTALGALTLQVYYRFLPTFQLEAAPAQPEPTETPVEDDPDIPITFI